MRFLLAILILLHTSPVFAIDWKELKSDHFIIYYVDEGPGQNAGLTQDKTPSVEESCREVLHKAELYYERIAADLGYQRSSDFWTWDNRAKIYIYPDKQGFDEVGNHPEWAAGMADYAKRSIMSYWGSLEFSDTVLPHEIAHLIFRDFVGFKGEVPLWLDEGVAQWTEEKKRQEVRRLVKDMYNRDALLTIDDMMGLDIKNIKNLDNVYIRSTRTRSGDRGVLFLTGNNLISAYYIEAVSLIDFLISKYGKSQFTSFCRDLRDGKKVEEALTTVYSDHIRNFEDFDDQWKKYIDNET